ncbi:MAG: ABC transporter substrate-binding protein [Lachnospiraceae bacterium]|nr:ABC transporter substrate-binding protein [Lachnospiraceae bacterium]
MRKKLHKFAALLLGAVMLTSGFGQVGMSVLAQETEEAAVAETTAAEEEQVEAAETAASSEEDIPEIAGLTYESQMELEYAECFDVYYYEGGYALIVVYDSASYLVVPEDMEVPEGLDEEIVVLQQPLDTIYLAATSAMALFDSLDALDSIRLSGTQASGWYIDNAVAAMEAGDIVYAGKYSEPDYELLVSEGCDLAIESTMILHSPKVQEMIELLGIPVFIDRSSYESHPLGRTEWIKAYAVLVDKEDAAEEFFAEQAQIIDEMEGFENTEQTVAYFYVSTDGTVVVRRPDDYIPKMIELAGGRYAFADLDDDSGKTSVSISMEEFYATAIDVDYLIYNASIDATVDSIDALLAKSELFADFKAVQEGNVWSTGKSLYQATDIVGEFIRDINLMLTDGEESEMMFLTRLE